MRLEPSATYKPEHNCELQQDDDPKHRLKLVVDWIKQRLKTIPNLNPIKNMGICDL